MRRGNAEFEQSGEHTRKNPYLEYEGKPTILGPANDAINSGAIRWTTTGNAIVALPSGEQITVLQKNQIHQIEQTFDSLAKNLQPGTYYEEMFSAERQAYEEAVNDLNGKRNTKKLRYGEIIYYPHPNPDLLIWTAPKKLKHLALLSRNEFLLQDPEQSISFEEQRKIFNSLVIGFLGASVASNAFHRVADTLRQEGNNAANQKDLLALAGWMKIADGDKFDDAVRGRRRFGILDYDRNKAEVSAREVNESYPWLPVSVYKYGVDPYGNVNDFILGNEEIGEPPVNRLIEAIDDIEAKLRFIEVARDPSKLLNDTGNKHQDIKGVDLWRIADIGTACQITWLPYGNNPDLPLTIGATDRELRDSLNHALENPSIETWFDFGVKLEGPHLKQVPEFYDFIKERIRSPFASAVPQLGIASETAASLVALGIASTSLGWKWPNRYFIEPRKGLTVWEWVYPERGTYRRDTTDIREGLVKRELFDLDGGTLLSKYEASLPTLHT